MALTQQLRRAGVCALHVERFVDTALLDLPVLKGVALVRQSYFRTVDVAFRAYEEARAGRPVTIKHLKRAAQRLVDVLQSDEARLANMLVLLTDIKQWRDYQSNHAANTAILSIGIGMAMQMSHNDLRDPGLAALLADIGTAAVDDGILTSADPLDEAQWQTIADHPLAAIPLLAGEEEMDAGLMRAAVACVQHHKAFSGGGYPVAVRERPSLFAQIIALADQYDAMTTPRPYRPVPMTPARAAERPCEAAGGATWGSIGAVDLGCTVGRRRCWRSFDVRRLTSHCRVSLPRRE